MKLYHVTCC